MMENTFWTAKEAADLWMKAHSIAEWFLLVEDYAIIPVLPERVTQWLAQQTAEFGRPIMAQLSVESLRGEKNSAKSLARFEEAFIANVDEQIEKQVY
jgi:hypothetical protein